MYGIQLEKSVKKNVFLIYMNKKTEMKICE